jgi:hypothetical protein
MAVLRRRRLAQCRVGDISAIDEPARVALDQLGRQPAVHQAPGRVGLLGAVILDAALLEVLGGIAADDD